LGGSQAYRRDLARGVTELVSVRPDGCPAAGGGDANSISADGRYVAFAVAADPYGQDDIVPGFHPAPGSLGIYVRDMVKRKTVAVSVSYDGRHGNNNTTSYDPQSVSISADGRYVAFDSFATNLVRGDTRPNGATISEIYVRDMRTGHTERIGPIRGRIVQGTQPSISGDGRYVAFGSTNQDLAGTPDYGFLPPSFLDDGPQQVYIYDRLTHHIDIASRSDAGITSDDWSDLGPSGRTISADGRYVVFSSYSNNLVSGDDSLPVGGLGDGTPDIYLYDRIARHLVRVTRSAQGIPANYTSEWPSISADGRWIAYDTGANNLGPIDLTYPAPSAPVYVNVGYDIYLYDRASGANTLVSHADNGVQGDFSSTNGVVSGDGKTVAFVSSADNLVPNDTNGQPDVFAWRS
jgi:Tol biopolymer transport system component